jgi:hypothetical protein
VELREITDENHDAVCALDVPPDQRRFVASVALSPHQSGHHAGGRTLAPGRLLRRRTRRLRDAELERAARPAGRWVKTLRTEALPLRPTAGVTTTAAGG